MKVAILPPVPFTVRLLKQDSIQKKIVDAHQLYTVVEVQTIANQTGFRLMELQEGIFLDAEIFIIYMANFPN
jgi:hypothetical protein